MSRGGSHAISLMTNGAGHLSFTGRVRVCCEALCQAFVQLSRWVTCAELSSRVSEGCMKASPRQGSLREKVAIGPREKLLSGV